MRAATWLKNISFILLLPLIFSLVLPAGSANAKPSISPQTEPPPEYFHHNWFEPIYLGGNARDSSSEWTTNNKTDVSVSFSMEGEGELTVSYEVYSYYSGWIPMHSVTFTESGNYDYKMGYYPTFPDDFYRYRVAYYLKETNGPFSVFGDVTIDYYDRWIPTGGGW
ncbi:hypothetical protein [Paenibacillus shenyangensis]|uniref:hypothetical protein n=1 Tax=Paenibacillus sp. A9 TaxID=1284352 RepID=UPI00037AB838|nr:hypothetical protein [Paenibacillus sp. A9]